MKRATLLSILPVICLAVLAPAQAADPTTGEPGNENRADAATRPVVEAVAECPPMVAEMRAVLALRNAELLELNAELDEAVDDVRALELVKRIKRVKLDAEAEILDVQLEYARRDGRDDAVRRLESAIEALRTPPRKRSPQPRPAPLREDAAADER